MAIAIDQPHVFLIFGTGWIATQIKELLEKQGVKVVSSDARIESREQVLTALAIHRPTRVINCAGLRGLPNADWCEDHKIETVRSNILGVLNVVDCCFQLGIHVTQLGSACIYDTDPTRAPDANFTEEDDPNYAGSWYSCSRLLSENSIKHYPNLLLLRIRAPIAADFNPNNLTTKLISYKKLVNLPASGTILPNLLPGAILLSQAGDTGIYNLISPSPFTNNQIMTLMKKYIEPSLNWENFELDDMHKVLKAPRCHPVFDSSKLINRLRELGHEVKDTPEALEELFIEMADKGYGPGGKLSRTKLAV
ncbi:epimerase/hydratase [Aspergillus japonicus CBS 114.51]|uniref:Epimerase/hydratase n=3 Tax=Aspergillus TaxID=5052 RepID=A0A2V5IA05_ASPV1|nr:epimerase/hydratase [Aspergillus japonicus CBS 114.51]PYI16456.1 epimerase/hydratase [Aspergillus violaceofuscus CBS 115571]PYI35871.1 epimerase/hydratase [Aspergillus indologenus CBS 114.80]RAH78039.1 epimerase/hydratase [Aspergillus japonicus CBS 114.51]